MEPVKINISVVDDSDSDQLTESSDDEQVPIKKQQTATKKKLNMGLIKRAKDLHNNVPYGVVKKSRQS